MANTTDGAHLTQRRIAELEAQPGRQYLVWDRGTIPGFGGSIGSAYNRYAALVVVLATRLAPRSVSWWLSG